MGQGTGPLGTVGGNPDWVSIGSVSDLCEGKALSPLPVEASKIVSKAKTQAQGLNDSLIAVKAEYEAKKAYVRQCFCDVS